MKKKEKWKKKSKEIEKYLALYKKNSELKRG